MGDRLNALEDQFFVGRGEQLATFARELEISRRSPSLIYVHGPEGSGKSALLRAFRRMAFSKGVRAWALPAVGERPFSSFLSALTRQTRVDGSGPPDTLGRAASAINRLASASGIVLLIDDYPVLSDWVPLIHENLFLPLKRGTLIALAGTAPPMTLSSGHLAWHAAMTTLPLTWLPEEAVMDLLDRFKIADPTVRRLVWQLSEGRPEPVHRMVSALVSLGQDQQSSLSTDSDIASFLIEHLLNVRSHRRQWRGLSGHVTAERVLAAASLVPRYDRDALAAVTGRPSLERFWPTLVRWSGPPSNGNYALPKGFAQHLSRAVSQRHPWVTTEWQRRSLSHHLRQMKTRWPSDASSSHWRQTVDLIQDTPLYAWLRPKVEQEKGWRVRRGESHDDLTKLAELLGPHPSWTRKVIHNGQAARPDEWLILEDPTGEVLGCLLLSEQGDEDNGTFPRECLRTLPPKPYPRTLLVWSRLQSRVGDAGRVVLLREAWRALRPRQTVIAWKLDLPATPSHVLRRLGFRPAAGRNVCSKSAAFSILSPSDKNFRLWVRLLLHPTKLPRADWSKEAREALTHLHDPHALSRTRAYAFFAHLTPSPTPQAARRWIEDALTHASFSAELPMAETLLRRYYLERSGQHEDIAEELSLSRTTYFRHHRRALSALGAALFGPGDGAPSQ